MSAPSASGCCRYGVANVLSTTASAPWACAARAIAAMSTMPRAGLVGVSSQTMRASSGQSSSSAAGSVRSTACQGWPSGPCTLSISRNVPPYASEPRTTPSPGPRRRKIASSAARPLANAKPCAAPSSDAKHASRPSLVGLPLRPYSHPAWSPTAASANVVDSEIGGTIAPLVGSGACPAWIARVENPCPSLTVHHPPVRQNSWAQWSRL